MKRQTLIQTLIVMFALGAKVVYSQGECWTTKTDMSEIRGFMPATVLNDSIYVIGGSLDASRSTSIVEAYDATTDSWTSKAKLPQKLCGATASTVNGKIYVIGGSTSVLGLGDQGLGEVVKTVYEYNPVSNSWTRKSDIPTPLEAAVAGVVDGKIYVIGGCPFKFTSSYNSVYEYNPATDTWVKKSDMPTARCMASATTVDGKIFVFGGVANLNVTAFSAVEVYDPSADSWALKGPMPVPKTAHASCTVDGNIYIISGGERMGTISDDVLEYNPASDSWAARTSIPVPRVAPAACSIGGKIYIIGGLDLSNTRLSTVEEYNPALDPTNTVSVGNDNSSEIPAFRLDQNYPNPFNPLTTINYVLPEQAHVRMYVFNIHGEEIISLVDSDQQAGFYTVKWDGRDSFGKPVSDGLYLSRFCTGDYNRTIRMLLLK